MEIQFTKTVTSIHGGGGYKDVHNSPWGKTNNTISNGVSISKEAHEITSTPGIYRVVPYISHKEFTTRRKTSERLLRVSESHCTRGYILSNWGWYLKGSSLQYSQSLQQGGRRVRDCYERKTSERLLRASESHCTRGYILSDWGWYLKGSSLQYSQSLQQGGRRVRDCYELVRATAHVVTS
ncbi:hypothetical protein J6590_068826 [Homalodisca vitripennis]|nr:hypothetical protein J6590_068826 [Homalodisca vitripennis]